MICLVTVVKKMSQEQRRTQKTEDGVSRDVAFRAFCHRSIPEPCMAAWPWSMHLA